MRKAWKLACVVLSMTASAPGLAQTPVAQSLSQPASAAPTTAPDATTPAGDNVVVTGKPRRHGVMRFLFGRNRRRGGFFANLFHGKKHWKTTAGHRQHCRNRFKSYNAGTNSYRGYSGVRHICVL